MHLVIVSVLALLASPIALAQTPPCPAATQSATEADRANAGACLIEQGTITADWRAGHALLAGPFTPETAPARQAAKALGFAYVEGRGVAIDEAAARRWYTQADQSDPEVRLMLATMTANGRGGPADPVAARAHLQAAAEAGSVRGMLRLAEAWFTGLGGPTDPAQGFAWTQLAAEKNDSRAQAALADLLTDGHGTAVDLPAARRWYETAAEHGSAYGARRLAQMLLAGEGGAADQTRGWAFLTMAAFEGDREARNIGRRMLPDMPDRLRYDAAQVRYAWELEFRPERHEAPAAATDEFET